MKVAVLLRVSTPGQADDDREGLPLQRAQVLAFVEREGHEIVATFEDRGVSGASRIEKRAGLSELLEASARGEFEAVIVPSRSRLARDVDVAGYVRSVLCAREVPRARPECDRRQWRDA